jgi:hypothetical protein
MHHNQRIGADKKKRGKDLALKIEAALILMLQLCALLALFF